MAKSWFKAGLALVAVGIGLLGAIVAGVFTYMNATARPLHPDAHAVPSARLSEPPATWADAAANGQQIARTAVTTQNLPGLSVAVGRSGERPASGSDAGLHRLARHPQRLFT